MERIIAVGELVITLGWFIFNILLLKECYAQDAPILLAFIWILWCNVIFVILSLAAITVLTVISVFIAFTLDILFG